LLIEGLNANGDNVVYMSLYKAFSRLSCILTKPSLFLRMNKKYAAVSINKMCKFSILLIGKEKRKKTIKAKLSFLTLFGFFQRKNQKSSSYISISGSASSSSILRFSKLTGSSSPGASNLF
jgi:hypothetical protein